MGTSRIRNGLASTLACVRACVRMKEVRGGGRPTLGLHFNCETRPLAAKDVLCVPTFIAREVVRLGIRWSAAAGSWRLGVCASDCLWVTGIRFSLSLTELTRVR